MTSPIFVITEAGNAAVTNYAATNTRVPISEFRVGSNFDTPATSLDTGLKGTLLYTSTALSTFVPDSQTQGIRLIIPADVGPFEFGEIGIFMPGGVMFARCSFGSPQTKFASSYSGVPNIWRFNALFRFSQAPVLFNIVTSSSSILLEVDNFGVLLPPGDQISGQNAVIVHESTPHGDSVLVYAHSPTRWTIDGYRRSGFITLSADSSGPDLPSPDWVNFPSGVSNQYLVQTLNGDIRGIQSNTTTGGVCTQPIGVLPAGSVLEVYSFGTVESPTTVTTLPYNDLVDAFNSVWSVPSGTTLADAKGWSQNALTTIPLGSIPSSTNWTLLSNAVIKAANLLDIPVGIPFSGLTSYWESNFFESLSKYTSLVNVISQVSGSKSGQAKPERMTRELLDTTTHIGTWSSAIHLDSVFTFASADAMEAFFNAGGWIGFDLIVSPDNYVQRVQELKFTSLGTLILKADRCETIGAEKIVQVNGDGLYTSAGNCGFWGLTGVYRTIWKHTFITGVSTAANTEEGFVVMKLEAFKSASNKISTRFTVEDQSLNVFSEDTKGGSPSITIDVTSGSPPISLLSSPVVASPTQSTSVTSNW